MMPYTVHDLARLSGVSVRTLHYYDEIGLLRPRARSESGYRLYTDAELLLLQQILLYRTLKMPLKDIAAIVHSPTFDPLHALEQHRKALMKQQTQLAQLLKTVDTTLAALKGDLHMTDEALYDGFPREAKQLRQEAMALYGEDTVRHAERSLKAMGREQRTALMAEFTALWETLAQHAGEPADSPLAQTLIARHYALTRQFWGTASSKDSQREAYAGLGALFRQDSRFTDKAGAARPQFAAFLEKAIRHFCEHSLS